MAVLLSPVRLVHVSIRLLHGLPQKIHAEEVALPFTTSSDIFWVQTLCHQGQVDKAVNMVTAAMDAPLPPDIYLSLLKACNHNKSFFQAQQVYAHLAQHHISLSGFLGDYLVMTLARCGAAEDALRLFLALPCRTVYSWTAIISAYTECGQGEDAFKLYKCMLDDGVEPDAYTFVCLFKACGHTIDLDHGRKLHSDARKKGLAADVFVGNTLMSMYGKCGAIEEAEGVFREVSKRNIVSWCVMLSVYVEQGQGGQAIRLYRQMLQEDINPDRLASMLALQACGLLLENEELSEVEGQSTVGMLLQIGQAIHVDACRKGFVSDAYFNSALVNMYGKGAAIEEAEHAFQAMSQRNNVSWNAMLSACVGQGRGEKALWFYRQMQREDICTDQLTLVFAFQACGILAVKEEGRRLSKFMCLEIGQALHADACKGAVAFDAILGSALISMYGKCKALMEAEYLFVSLSEHNIVSWNAMLSAFVEQGQSDKALKLYRQLKEENLSPDELSCATALQACATFVEKKASSNLETQSNKIMALEIGRSLHSDAQRRGFASGLAVGNALLRLYAKSGSVVEAEHVFVALSRPSLVSWNLMLRAYVDQGQAERTLQLFDQMQKQHMIHDDVTVISVVQACSATGSLEVCKHLHFHMVSIGYDQVPSVAATVIHAYGCYASMAEAHALFDELWDPHVASWNACISGHAGEGNYVASLHLFEMLKLSGMMPNEVTFTALLSVCSHTGLLMESLEYFESISIDYGLTMDEKHNSILLDLLGRIGDFTKINAMIERIQFKADLSTLLCLLGACRVHGNLELARRAFDCALQSYPKEVPVYVLMSNIYADAGLQE